jgi:hypothetical protein
MTKWTKEERDAAVKLVDNSDQFNQRFWTSHDIAIELACQRNRALAALKVGRFYCRAYGELAEAIGDPCSTVPEDLQQIDAAIAVCKEDK